jgi:hypothetical protein
LISTELFPYENHPYRLEFGEKKNPTVCFFSCEEHLQKYLTRYKLDERTIKLDYRDGEPVESGKKQQNSIQKRPRKTSDRSSGTSKGRTTLVDSPRNTTSPTKRKK